MFPAYKYIDVSVRLNRTMESHTQDTQRIKKTSKSRHSVESSHALREQPPPPELVHGTQGQEQRSRSKAIKELRQLGAVDFFGTTDPAEAETWLKRTERVFTLMGSTEEDQFFYIVSLLQGDTYD